MSRLFRPRMLLLAGCLPTTLAGCATWDTAPPPVRVEVPAECERILQEAVPPAVRAGDDIRVVTAKGAVTIRLANRRIKSARECLAEQRQKYSEAK